MNKDARQYALFYECLDYSFERISLGTSYIDMAVHQYVFSYEPLKNIRLFNKKKCTY